MPRYMIQVRATASSEAGEFPDDPTLVPRMMAFHDEMAKAGVLLDGAGLQPSSQGFRVHYDAGGQARVHREHGRWTHRPVLAQHLAQEQETTLGVGARGEAEQRVEFVRLRMQGLSGDETGAISGLGKLLKEPMPAALRVRVYSTAISLAANVEQWSQAFVWLDEALAVAAHQEKIIGLLALLGSLLVVRAVAFGGELGLGEEALASDAVVAFVLTEFDFAARTHERPRPAGVFHGRIQNFEDARAGGDALLQRTENLHQAAQRRGDH